MVPAAPSASSQGVGEWAVAGAGRAVSALRLCVLVCVALASLLLLGLLHLQARPGHCCTQQVSSALCPPTGHTFPFVPVPHGSCDLAPGVLLVSLSPPALLSLFAGVPPQFWIQDLEEFPCLVGSGAYLSVSSPFGF